MRMRVTFNSPVILTLVILCFITTILNYFTDGLTNKLIFMEYHSSLTNPLTYVRFFTHILGHENLSHFLGNAVFLLLLGPMLEEKYGSVLIIRIILITAFVTGIINYLLFWNTALCGASGVVFAFIMLTSFTGFKEGEIPLTFILVAVLFLGQQVINGITVHDNISNISHLLGGFIGSVYGYKMNKR